VLVFVLGFAVLALFETLGFVVTAGGIQTAHLAGTEAESATKATNKIIGILD